MNDSVDGSFLAATKRKPRFALEAENLGFTEARGLRTLEDKDGSSDPSGQDDNDISEVELVDQLIEAEHLVAVQPRLEVAGVYQPGWQRKNDPCPMTFDWREFPGSPGNLAKVRAGQLVLPIQEALDRHWDSAAMAVRYLVRHDRTNRWLANQPRVNKEGVKWLKSQGYSVWINTLFVDVDNPDHRVWTPEDVDEFQRILYEAEPLKTAGWYTTRAGYRVIQPLSRPVPVEGSEDLIYAYLLTLDRAGIKVDFSCADWTHVFRMPRTFRDGFRLDRTADTGSMLALDPDTMPRHSAVARGKTPKPKKKKPDQPVGEDGFPAAAEAKPTLDDEEDTETLVPRREGTIEYVKELAPHWMRLVEQLGNIIKLYVKSDWRKMYLALGGSLLFRRIPHELVPELIHQIAISAGSAKPASHRDWARGTCNRHAIGARVSGYRALKQEWPDVARLLRNLTVRIQQQLAVDTELVNIPKLSDARQKLLMAMVGAASRPGVTVISTPCGLGKTTGAINGAMLRAEVAAPEDRSPPGSKTAISFDKNRLAIQSTKNIVSANGLVRRYRSPVSVEDESGKPVCVFHESAAAIQKGGQSVHWEFCEGKKVDPCPHRPPQGTCRAYGAYEGDELARIATGNHGMLHQLAEFAGGTGLLVVDEPPSILETIELTASHIQDALASKKHFASRYMDAMTPIVQALAIWMGDQDITEEPIATNLGTALTRSADRVGSADLTAACAVTGVDVSPQMFDDEDPFGPRRPSAAARMFEAVRRALSEDARSDAPPIRKHDAIIARKNVKFAEQLGRASKVYRILYEYVNDRMPDHALRAVIRVVEKKVKGGQIERVALITAPRIDFVKALLRGGPTVLSDANADLHIPIIEKILGTDEKPFLPRIVTIEAQDRARVERSIAPLPRSSRAGWLVAGRPIWQAGILSAIRRTVAWVARDHASKCVCLITYRVIAVAIRAALNPTSEPIKKAWTDSGLKLEWLVEAIELLQPILTSWPGEWILGHYGGLRGLDNAMRADAFITLGDPWPNLGEVANEVAFVGLSLPFEARARALCRAELEQAHGRARAPERTTPCRMLHVGNVVPGGRPWTSPDVHVLEVPPSSSVAPHDPSAARVDAIQIRQLLGLTVDQLADRIGIPPAILTGYESGLAAMPAPVYASISSLLKEI